MFKHSEARPTADGEYEINRPRNVASIELIILNSFEMLECR